MMTKCCVSIERKNFLTIFEIIWLLLKLAYEVLFNCFDRPDQSSFAKSRKVAKFTILDWSALNADTRSIENV